MRSIRSALLFAAVAAFLVALPTARADGQPAQNGPVKVFILAGQSNMVGDGHLGPADIKGTLEYMVKSSDRTDRFEHLVDAGGEWVARDDVWYFQRQLVKTGRGAEQTIDAVDVAAELRPGLQGSGDRLRIGPELQFGHVMGDHFDNQVLIIKTAWGGKSLAVDFRPPSAGEPPYELKANKSGVKPDVGKFYRLMLADVKYVLDHLEEHFPGYDGQGYEIAGFGWHQGWNDGCNALFADEYEANLPRFIADVRKDLGARDLPVVVATSGFGGHAEGLPGVRARIKAVVEPAQIAAGESVVNVTSVPTRDFFRPREESPTGASYHWNSNAETYFLIGDSMAKAMIALMEASAE